MIYLDNNATSRMLGQSVAAMLPFLVEEFGNPSSRHPLGRAARAAVEAARSDTKSWFGAEGYDLVFTSGGSESVSLAFQSGTIIGPSVVLTTAVEHACVQDAALVWERTGRPHQMLPVNTVGLPDLDQLEAILRRHSGRAFVSMIWVNNETGTIASIAEVAVLCRRYGALLHVDAVQAPTRIAVDLNVLNCDYLSWAAHKFHGPKGAGGLFIRSGAPVAPLIPGHQEGALRGGTENVAAIVGAATALSAQVDWREESERQALLRDQLERGVVALIPGSDVNCPASGRVANTTNIYFPNRNAADLVARLGQAGVCASAGAACTSPLGKPSHVLLAVGHPPARAAGSVRFSVGRYNDAAEIPAAISIIEAAYHSTLSTWGDT